MPRRVKPKHSPIIDALYESLPAREDGFSPDQQAEWIEMMRRALRLTYGGGPLPPAATVEAAAPAPAASAEPVPAPPARKKKAAAFPFFIDHQGYARKKNGDQVLPSEVTDILYDLRGEAPSESIIWADGSQGLLEAGDVTVSAVFN